MIRTNSLTVEVIDRLSGRRARAARWDKSQAAMRAIEALLPHGWWIENAQAYQLVLKTIYQFGEAPGGALVNTGEWVVVTEISAGDSTVRVMSDAWLLNTTRPG